MYLLFCKIRYFTDSINMIQGFYIFLIYVCNRKVLSIVFKCCIKKKPDEQTNVEKKNDDIEMRNQNLQQKNPSQDEETSELVNYDTTNKKTEN